MISDTHSHLDFDLFDLDRDRVIERARKNDIRFILNPGVNLDSSNKAVKIAEIYPEVYASVGVHPNEALSWNKDSIEELECLINHPKVVAIGEIGLDYYRDKAPRWLQKEVFQAQLDLAARWNLPIIVHTRNSTTSDDTAIENALELIRSWITDLPEDNHRLKENPGVMHSFSGNVELAREAVKWNLSIGVTGPVTYKNASLLEEVVRILPLNSILVETDSPFLTPVPYRGKRNEPFKIRYIIQKIAEIRDIAYDFVACTTLKNSERIFQWQAKH